jgi:8-oxo-dGTP pyrophosphatase MutT (NUDIX family)
MAKGGSQQVAALPWRRKKNGAIEVLLITSRETKRWVIPKGWPMDGLKDYNAARQEAYEEAGVEGHMSRIALGTFAYDKRFKAGSLKPIGVTVYSLEVEKLLRSWPEKKQRQRKWFSSEDAAKLVHEPELKTLIAAFSI